MKKVQVTFAGGGPLDNTTRDTSIPSHWKYLRYEHQQREGLHIYYGPVGVRRTKATLQYLGIDGSTNGPK